MTTTKAHGKLGDMNNKPQGPDFQTLVLNLKRDRSYEAIAKLAGGQPKAKALQQLVQKGFTRLPDVATFDGLSRAFNVSKRELVLAAARTLGIDVGDDDQNDLVLIGAKRLPQESQDLLVSMSREMQAWKDGQRESESHVIEPTKPGDLPVIIGVGSRPEKKEDPISDPDDPANYDLAAHPNFETNRDRFDKEHGSAGEENQDTEGDQ